MPNKPHRLKPGDKASWIVDLQELISKIDPGEALHNPDRISTADIRLLIRVLEKATTQEPR